MDNADATTRSRWLMAALVAAIVTLSFASPAVATAHVQRMVTFAPSAGELPESIAVDRRGTIYVSLAPLGQVRAIGPDGRQHPVATLPVGSGFGALGLALDPRGDIYVAVSTFDEGAAEIGRQYRMGVPVVFDMADAPPDAARRILDFVSGVTFALRGRMVKVGGRAFLVVPEGVE
ncbi:MAG: cell division protein SepF, partial [Actinobacteria bacterium]|nr:cell division protein SepF [Actinomycetota bacterium]